MSDLVILEQECEHDGCVSPLVGRAATNFPINCDCGREYLCQDYYWRSKCHLCLAEEQEFEAKRLPGGIDPATLKEELEVALDALERSGDEGCKLAAHSAQVIRERLKNE